jgi:hypothetical protein
MDRMDYLKTDSFYSGVAWRKSTQPIDSNDECRRWCFGYRRKGIYSVEKFLMSRRLMYWQAYLHKTSLVSIFDTNQTCQRIDVWKEWFYPVVNLCTFLANKATMDTFHSESDLFCSTGWFDIISALKDGNVRWFYFVFTE